jgi:superfamily II DNA or RNA helicase
VSTRDGAIGGTLIALFAIPCNSVQRMPVESDDDREICQSAVRTGAQSLPHPGTLVMARGHRWKVTSHVVHADCVEVHLANNALGPTILLSPFDRFVDVHPEPHCRAVRLRAWITEMRKHATAAKVGGLRAAHVRADVLPYQIAPAVAVANGEPRVILADEVGLGKTIQAGWILADVMARCSGARALIAVPAGLRDQWGSELSRHFAIEAIVADARWLRRTFADLPGDVSPWSLPGVYLTSIDFIKRPDVLRGLDDQSWEVLIVDEVHTAAAPTDRHAAIASLAHRARRIVAISATPYSGDPRGFESIARLGATPNSAPPVMFRRSRDDVGALAGRRHRFAPVRLARNESRLQRLIAQYTAEVWREAVDNGDAVRLAMTVLRKRALSSPRAVLRSLERRLDLLVHGGPAPRQMRLFDEEDALDDEEPLDALSAPGLNDSSRERRWLAALIDAARRAAVIDSKLRFLQRLLRRLGDEAAIVFTEYRDTLMQLGMAFPRAGLLHGGMSRQERSDAQGRFNDVGGLLLATDAASEGLNLQGRCRLVINYELPWNPARLEQRIGRVDRIGQRRAVHALTLVARDTAEDLVIARLTRRLQRIAVTLGERDRLAAFLDDARTARIVIANTSLDESFEPAPFTSLTRPPVAQPHASDEACRLAFLQRIAQAPDQNVLVAVVPERRDLKEGFAFLFRWSATTSDGIPVETDLFIVHVADHVLHERFTAAAARAVADKAMAHHAQSARSFLEPRLKTRLDAVAAEHAAAVDRLIDRERALSARRDLNAAVQPGLFDRRAVQRADRLVASVTACRLEHERYLDALAGSRRLESDCDLAGVLIVCHRPSA